MDIGSLKLSVKGANILIILVLSSFNICRLQIGFLQMADIFILKSFLVIQFRRLFHPITSLILSILLLQTCLVWMWVKKIVKKMKCTISEKVVFEKWNITTNGEANQNNFINEWRGEAESWVYEIILICQVMSCDISFHKNHFFRNFISKIIVYDGLCNKFWEMILRNDISWH